MIAHSIEEGAKIGVAVAIPVGPVALLVMRRAVSEGRFAGFISALGAATADLICGTISLLFLSALTALKERHHLLLQLGGGVFMLAMGVYTMRAKPPSNSKPAAQATNFLAGYLSTLALTLANPLTLVGLVGVTAASGIGVQRPSHEDVAFLASGIFLGSASWWLVLTASAGWLGRKLGANLFHTLNLVAGGAIALFGVWQLVAAGRHIWNS